jgi:hypothetical protein
MNFGFLSLLLQNPLQGAIVLTCVLFGMVLHNVVQALLADRLGDSTSRTYGFHGTDPRIHLDGLTLAFVVLLGFGRPNSIPLRGSSLRGRGGNSEAMVWLSGPLGMIVFALVLKLVAGGVALLPNELFTFSQYRRWMAHELWPPLVRWKHAVFFHNSSHTVQLDIYSLFWCFHSLGFCQRLRFQS